LIVLLDGYPFRHGGHVLGLRLLPLTPLVLYRALLFPNFFIAKKVSIPPKH
jgi:hypothetical protein